MSTTNKEAVTKTVEVEGTPFAYREVGPTTGVPVVFLHHFTAVLDDWDPAVVDGIAAERRVILVDLRGVGGSGGTTPDSVEAMAGDTIAFLACSRTEPGRPAGLLPGRHGRPGGRRAAARPGPPHHPGRHRARR